MPGFFNKATVDKQRRRPIKKAGRASNRKLDCESCGLHKLALSPKMTWKGQGRMRILVIGEAPGPTEDEQDDILVGEAGSLLREVMGEVGIDLELDCWRINAANCWPGKGNPDPTKHQIECCRVFRVRPTIEELKPQVIVLMGNGAMSSFFGDRGHPKLQISTYRGRVIPDDQTGAWVIPIFHPSFLLYKRDKKGVVNPNLAALFERDMRRVLARASRPAPVPVDPVAGIRKLLEYKDVIYAIKSMIAFGVPYLAFDYESTGLKPFAPGHRLVSVSFATRFKDADEISTYAFLLDHPEAPWTPKQLKGIKEAWGELMLSDIRKVAHNIRMEDMWTRVKLGIKTKSWWWCTMNNAHIVDNTQGITSLKFQAWVQWGMENYDAAVHRFVVGVLTKEQRAAGETLSTHHGNRILELSVDELLEYNGADAKCTAMLYEKQAAQIRPDTGLWRARGLFHVAAMMFNDINVQGVAVDEQYYDVKKKELLADVAKLERKLLRSREAKLFQQREGHPLSLGSSPDLGKLLYTHLGQKTTKRTKIKREPSVDAEALGRMDLPFVSNLLEMRHLQKIANTYMDQIRRESVNGRVYPSTNFNIPRTYRPSMDGPNLANTPKREELAKELVRRGIVADRGFKMMEADYSGIEVHTMAWYSEDPELIRYLNDPTTDMHRDQAQALFKIPPKMWAKLDPKAVKMLRFYVKNQWVFPQWYGSWYKQCAEDLWKMCAELLIGDGEGTTVRQHLGMSYTRYEEFVRLHENVFWDQFGHVRDWQDKLSTEYQRKGYVETFFGFRYRDWMSRNQLYNCKIQGTAFHLLLWAMTQLHFTGKEEQWKSHLLWQIYDSIIWNLWPKEQELILQRVEDVMVREATETFDWITTPLKVDTEITKVGGAFADLKELDDSDNYEEVA